MGQKLEKRKRKRRKRQARTPQSLRKSPLGCSSTTTSASRCKSSTQKRGLGSSQRWQVLYGKLFRQKRRRNTKTWQQKRRESTILQLSSGERKRPPSTSSVCWMG